MGDKEVRMNKKIQNMNIFELSNNLHSVLLKRRPKLRKVSHNFIFPWERGRKERNIRDRNRRN